MKYRRWGRTELFLSVFSLGTMRCLSSEQNMEETIQAAYDLGINHFETAQGYGESEKYLGNCLDRLGLRTEVYVTTKITPKRTSEEMQVAIDQSFQSLNARPIDCLAIHGINTQEHLDWVLNPEGCMAAVHQARQQNKVRFVGFSTHGSLEVILRAIESNLFDFVNLHYNFFFQRNAPALDAAIAHDMGVFIISPADKGGQLYTPSEELENLCAPYTPLHWAYRFLLQNKAITTLSVGPADPSELSWPLEVADQVHPLFDAEIKVQKNLEETARKRLKQDQCLQCFDCLPCPEDINIPEVLRLRNLSVAYGMQSFGQYRYQMFERAGHWFPGRLGARCTDCGDCLPRCPSNLPIPELLRDTHQKLHQPSRPRLWDDRP